MKKIMEAESLKVNDSELNYSVQPHEKYIAYLVNTIFLVQLIMLNMLNRILVKKEREYDWKWHAYGRPQTKCKCLGNHITIIQPSFNHYSTIVMIDLTMQSICVLFNLHLKVLVSIKCTCYRFVTKCTLKAKIEKVWFI